ncbi:Glu-tRNA(Gln) amidotransferase subunit GatE [Candidatus Woesearchaeota archaeon]|nr:Glu-tRNA(Gln) amidotransferase subunit GatE [Candidatus Woesearchaeota archaeon]
MADTDRKDDPGIGLKCGIEIHQQLEGKKLFCGCPTEIRKGSPDFTVTRRLRAAAGETGEIDQAAEHEERKAKTFVYQGYADCTCLVETDEEPPHAINKDALEATVIVCRQLGARLVDEVQVMRKTVIDGSNTSGFQRTALVGMDGSIELDGRRISIPTVCLEEEACQVVERTAGKDVYNLSRLGIPLIEIASGPDITTPEEARRVCERIGMILRSTGRCKRGIGSIRQDVNVSIKGGARVEIKGFQDLRSIPKVIDGEIARQQSLVAKGRRAKNEVRKAEPDFSTSFLRPMPGASRMYPETDVMPFPTAGLGAEMLESVESQLARLIGEHGLSEETAKTIVKDGIPFARYAARYSKVEPRFIAATLLETPKELRRKHKIDADLMPFMDEVLGKLDEGAITKDAVPEVLLALGRGERVDYARYLSVPTAEVEAFIRDLVAKHPGAPIGGLMGQVMAEYRGKVDGKRAMDLLRKHHAPGR